MHLVTEDYVCYRHKPDFFNSFDSQPSKNARWEFHQSIKYHSLFKVNISGLKRLANCVQLVWAVFCSEVFVCVGLPTFISSKC